jgi:DNA-binding beta-propeller fold protein YncE
MRRAAFVLAIAAAAAAAAVAPESPYVLLVTNSDARHLSFVDPVDGTATRVEVGATPWGVAVGSDGRAYVATAEGVAVVDTKRRARVALVPYASSVGAPAGRFDEYRPGGQGIAVSPDARFAYVGVHAAADGDQLEILDTRALKMVGRVPIGRRPFDVVASADGREVYALDHDSYSVTVVEPAARTARRIEVAPEGRGGFDKPHYGALRADGTLLLPFSGRSLAVLDPRNGAIEKLPLTANTHQHGIALTRDGSRALIVGTAAYGGASRGPSLTVYDLDTRRERIVPLARPHEQVAASPDGKLAYLTGGFTFRPGWSGITVVDLEKLAAAREIAVPDLPLGIRVLPR